MRSTPTCGPTRSGAADHVVPSGVALRGRNGDRPCEIKKVWRPGEHRPISLNPENELVAVLDTERITHCLRYGHLAFGGPLSRSVHGSPYIPNEVRIPSPCQRGRSVADRPRK